MLYYCAVKTCWQGFPQFPTIIVAVALFIDQSVLFALVSISAWEKAAFAFIIKCALWPILFAGDHQMLLFQRCTQMIFILLRHFADLSNRQETPLGKFFVHWHSVGCSFIYSFRIHLSTALVLWPKYSTHSGRCWDPHYTVNFIPHASLCIKLVSNEYCCCHYPQCMGCIVIYMAHGTVPRTDIALRSRGDRRRNIHGPVFNSGTYYFGPFGKPLTGRLSSSATECATSSKLDSTIMLVMYPSVQWKYAKVNVSFTVVVQYSSYSDCNRIERKTALL